jgi:ATP-dependent Clp protease ATP-binding subunit ClpC
MIHGIPIGGGRSIFSSIREQFIMTTPGMAGGVRMGTETSTASPGGGIDGVPSNSNPVSTPPAGETYPWEDLTEFVRRGDVAGASPFAGDKAYAEFFDLISRGLHRTMPRHLLLLRERGVGEQTVLLELARRGIRGEPPFLKSRRLVYTDLRRIPLEQTRSALHTFFAAVSPADNLIVCVDGFATLLRDHAYGEHRSLTLAALSRARCRVVGILTPREYEELLADDAESHELFAVLRLHEPETAVATELVRQVARGLEKQYRVVIKEQAVRRAVSLSDSYILHERLPYKAIKVLRSVCDDVEYDRSQCGAGTNAIDETQIVEKVAQFTGVPAATLAGIGEGTDYYSSLGEVVVGQDHAVREIATELGLIKAGLTDPGKPASVMLFIGQTGTGKTEMAKALARLYSPSQRLKTFTLGNFSEPHSVSGIIGVPPGYVGHAQGGRLINDLNADPYSVFLLDEADKAHPDVMQPFLNLFDEGWIYDQRGVKAYADRAMFIMTTNVGQRQIADLCKKGKPIEEITWTMKESLSRIRHSKSNRPVFTPEFLARIKRFIVFRSLDAEAMSGICRRRVADLSRDWLLKRQKTLRVADNLVELIARKAYASDTKSQGKEGGRVIRKLLADTVESKIQAAINLGPVTYRASNRVEIGYEPATDSIDDGNRTNDLRPDAVTVSFHSDLPEADSLQHAIAGAGDYSGRSYVD